MSNPSAEPVTVLGFMSGTSMDGVDAAVIETDGKAHVVPAGPALGRDYEADVRAAVRAAVDAGRDVPVDGPIPDDIIAVWARAESLLTQAHIACLEAVKAKAAPGVWERIGLIGFHGQTVLHRPDQRLTVQLGDGDRLARAAGKPVVCDFRLADVAAGGQGAPFAPLYHRALAERVRAERGLDGAMAALNLGGVGNVTWIGSDGGILAFDTGPANGPIDDWIERHTGTRMDVDGSIAAQGRVHEDRVAAMLDHGFFDVKPPKSLDRLDFGTAAVNGLSLEDGAATLTAFTAASVARAVEHMAADPVLWIACGGGRKNPTLMRMLNERLPGTVEPAESVGWNGDFLEAQAFAYLAVRSTRGLPLSLPETTGVPEPCPGGRVISP